MGGLSGTVCACACACVEYYKWSVFYNMKDKNHT